MTHLLRVRAALTKCKILVADDVLTNRQLIVHSLRKVGFTRILTAADGEQALELTRAEAPDFLLLDLLMPNLDGFEVCATLRREAQFVDLPILSMTALENPEERARAFAAGATDMILKPIHHAELIARTTTHLERRLLIRGLREFHDRTAAELAMAREMQQALLPEACTVRHIHERYGVSAAALFMPSTELGGDIWGIWPIDAARFGIYALDFSGHGTIAAINTFRLHTLLAHKEFDRSQPGTFLASVNDRLSCLLSPEHFATMVYATIDIDRNVLTYAAAGAPAMVIASPDATLLSLDGSGVPLGIQGGVVYPQRDVPFGPGARLLLHSDALPEARRLDGTLLGEGTAHTMAAAALRCGSAAEVVADLASRLAAVAGRQLDDDLTLVCLMR